MKPSGSGSERLGERRRARSNTVSGPNPLEVPITASDQQLAALIARVKLQTSRERAPSAVRPPIVSPAVIGPSPSVPSRPTLQRASVISPHPECEPEDENELDGEKTPTQRDFRPANLSF